jgi:hypothetical protein
MIIDNGRSTGDWGGMIIVNLEILPDGFMAGDLKTVGLGISLYKWNQEKEGNDGNHRITEEA